MPSVAQQSLKTLLVGVDHRSVVSLNGQWHYLVDQPPARGLYTANGKVRDNGYALNTRPNISSGPHNEEYDFATAPTIKVPGDWNTQDPTLFRYEGVVWYQRDFDFQPKAGTRTFSAYRSSELQVVRLGEPEAYLRSRGWIYSVRLRSDDSIEAG